MSTPFMQFYVADYLGDTRHLTTEQHGAYLLLLMGMWRWGGSLPNDDDKLARMAGLTPTRWNKIKAEVMDLMLVTEGRVTQKRLLAELEKAQGKSKKRSNAGRAGGIAKALKDKKPRVAKARVLPQHSSEPDSEPEKKVSKKEKGAGAPVLPGMEFPTWWPVEAWQGFVESRKKIKKPLTERAVKVAIDKLTKLRAAGEDPAAVLDKATFGSWTGLYAVGEDGPPRRGAPVPLAEASNFIWAARIANFRGVNPRSDVEKGFWDAAWGGSPSTRGMGTCRIPEDAFREYDRRYGKNRDAG